MTIPSNYRHNHNWIRPQIFELLSAAIWLLIGCDALILFLRR